MDFVVILFRWMHILAAITAVGGTFFMRLALVPAVSVLSEEEHQKLREAVRSKWAKFVHMSIAFLLISGFYNYLMVVRPAQDVPKVYHMVIGTKILLALGIFFIASMLMGRSEAAKKFQQNAKKWLTISSVLALIVVCMSGVLRSMHNPKYKPEAKLPEGVEMPAEDLPSVDLGTPVEENK